MIVMDEISFDLNDWIIAQECDTDNLEVFAEREGGRDNVFEALVFTTVDHLIGLRVIEKIGGFPKSQRMLKGKIPTDKKSRSGFLGEILATEYVGQETAFEVPLKRLRHKDTRELAMRGDDVLGFRRAKTKVKAIKVEAKSRAKLATNAIEEAREGLEKRNGRPNPETLAFVECELRLQERDDEAEIVADFQTQNVRASDITHLLFTISGNNPATLLSKNCAEISKGVKLIVCGIKLANHGKFVKSLFETCIKKGDSNGDS